MVFRHVAFKRLIFKGGHNILQSDEEIEAEEVAAPSKPRPKTPVEGVEISEAERAMMAAKKKHEDEEEQKLRDYEEQRRIQREKEEEEIRLLKEKQERRKIEREEEERQLAERRREEEERRKQEEEERKTKAEQLKKKKEEEKKRREELMGKLNFDGKANIVIQKKDKTEEKFDKFGNIVKAKAEMGLTKEQQEEAKRRAIAEISKPLQLDGLSATDLKKKIKEIHQRICRLEADKYDLEKRKERQEYDLKELNERQRQINRNKALKKGLDPNAASSRYPPKVAVSSKYDRQIDRRSFGERKHIYEKANARPHFPNVPPVEEPMEKVIKPLKKVDDDGDGDMDAEPEAVEAEGDEEDEE